MGFKERKDRYFTASEYNMTRVVNRLAELVESAGGTVDRHTEERLIHTRGYDEKIDCAKRNIERIDFMSQMGAGDKQHAEKAIETLKSELSELQGLKESAPIVKTNFVSLTSDLWIKFELDGCHYYIQFDNNPFFPDGWYKIPVADKDNRNAYYMDEIDGGDKEYYTNDMFAPVAKEETIEKAAEWIFDFMKNQKCTLW